MPRRRQTKSKQSTENNTLHTTDILRAVHEMQVLAHNTHMCNEQNVLNLGIDASHEGENYDIKLIFEDSNHHRHPIWFKHQEHHMLKCYLYSNQYLVKLIKKTFSPRGTTPTYNLTMENNAKEYINLDESTNITFVQFCCSIQASSTTEIDIPDMMASNGTERYEIEGSEDFFTPITQLIHRVYNSPATPISRTQNDHWVDGIQMLCKNKNINSVQELQSTMQTNELFKHQVSSYNTDTVQTWKTEWTDEDPDICTAIQHDLLKQIMLGLECPVKGLFEIVKHLELDKQQKAIDWCHENKLSYAHSLDSLDENEFTKALDLSLVERSVLKKKIIAKRTSQLQRNTHMCNKLNDTLPVVHIASIQGYDPNEVKLLVDQWKDTLTRYGSAWDLFVEGEVIWQDTDCESIIKENVAKIPNQFKWIHEETEKEKGKFWGKTDTKRYIPGKFVKPKFLDKVQSKDQNVDSAYRLADQLWDVIVKGKDTLVAIDKQPDLWQTVYITSAHPVSREHLNKLFKKPGEGQPCMIVQYVAALMDKERREKGDNLPSFMQFGSKISFLTAMAIETLFRGAVVQLKLYAIQSNQQGQ